MTAEDPRHGNVVYPARVNEWGARVLTFPPLPVPDDDPYFEGWEYHLCDNCGRWFYTPDLNERFCPGCVAAANDRLHEEDQP
jgi:hypothetical protein